MAEVMKFDDFKNEGSEAAVKVNVTLMTSILCQRVSIYFNRCLFLFFSNRPLENTDTKDETTSSKMET